MEERLIISYDRDDDTLYLDVVEPYAEQETDITDNWIAVRTNPQTSRVENIEIMQFSRRFRETGARLELPVGAVFSRLLDGLPLVLPRAANR